MPGGMYAVRICCFQKIGPGGQKSWEQWLLERGCCLSHTSLPARLPGLFSKRHGLPLFQFARHRKLIVWHQVRFSRDSEGHAGGKLEKHSSSAVQKKQLQRLLRLRIENCLGVWWSRADIRCGDVLRKLQDDYEVRGNKKMTVSDGAPKHWRLRRQHLSVGPFENLKARLLLYEP